MAAVAALVAPWFVDWDVYRAEFEDYGRRLTGRQVEIAGRIDARLFPWPALILNEVKVSNPEGARIPNLVEARRIEMRMALAPLISGRLEVEEINLDRPVFAFERLPGGSGSWSLTPQVGLALLDPERVAVSEVSISDATIFLGDDRRGGLARIENFAATLSAPALSGPWRLRGQASYGGAAMELGLTTGKIRPGEPLRLAVRLSPLDGPGKVYSFDGEIGDRGAKSVKGSIKIGPTLPGSGKADAEVGLRPFVVRAEVEADFDNVVLKQIEIAPEHSADAANYITGEATIDLGPRIAVNAALSAARLDLDILAGRRGRELMQSPDRLLKAASTLAGLPEGLDLDLDIAVTSLVVGGETLETGRLKVAVNHERMRIDELAAAMPGQTRGRFSGLLVFGPHEPLMSGDIVLDSVSFRDFVVWLSPQRRRDIEDVWSGARGRLKLDAKLDLAAGRLRLTEARAVLDESNLAGNLNWQDGTEPGLKLRLSADHLNLDRYIPRGLSQLFGQSGIAVGIVDVIAGSMTAGDVEVTAEAGRLQLHGVEAEDVAIDVGANENGIDLRTIEIGRVGAARLDISGLVRFPGDGIAGSVNALIDAHDPRGLLRLFGAFGPEGEPEPAWAKAVGPLDLKLLAEATAEDRITTAVVALTGKAGEATASFNGRFRGERSNWQDADIQVSGEVAAPSGLLLADLVGLRLVGGADRPSRIAGSSTGSLSRGLVTAVETELVGAKAQFAGTVREGRTGLEAEGRLALLAEQANELLAALGLPGQELSPLARVLSAESAISYDGIGVRLSGLSGTAGGAAFNGEITFATGPVSGISGHIATGRLSLPWLLELLLMPRDGEPHDLSSRFAFGLPDIRCELRITADRLEILPNVSLELAETKLRLEPLLLGLTGSGTGPAGEPAKGNLEVRLDSRGAEIDGYFDGKLALDQLLLADDGAVVIDAEPAIKLSFSGVGRSPAGLLSAAQAEGTYGMSGGVLSRVDPRSFARDLAEIKQPAEVDRLITGSLRSGDLAFKGGSGTIKIANGVLTATPLAIVGEGATGEARFLLEVASGNVDLSLALALTEPKDIPGFELAYAGHPRALQASSNAQELKSHLAVKLLQESVKQFEDLQRQELELLEKEQRFRREQQDPRRSEDAGQRQPREADAQDQLSEPGNDPAAADGLSGIDGPAPETTPGQADAVAVEPISPPAREAERGPVADTAPPVAKTEPQPVVEAAPEPAASSEPLEPSAVTDSGPLLPPVPLPKEKPKREPEPVSRETSLGPLQLPLDGHLGRISRQVFSGPKVLQPDLDLEQQRRLGPDR